MEYYLAIIASSVTSLRVALVAVAVIAYVTRDYVIKAYEEYTRACKLDRVTGTYPKHFLLGHLPEFFMNQTEGMSNLAKRTLNFPEMFNFWLLPMMSHLHIYHPDPIKDLIKGETPKSKFGYNFLKWILGDGVFVSVGEKWKRNRRLMTSSLYFGALRRQSHLFNDCVRIMVDKWSHVTDSRPIEVAESLNLMTLDNILRFAISEETNCQLEGNNSFVETLNLSLSLLWKRLNNPFYFSDFVYSRTSDGRKMKETTKVLKDYVKKIIFERRQTMTSQDGSVTSQYDDNNNEKRDFLDTLLKAQDNGGLSDVEIQDEFMTFIAAGQDTTACSLSWAMYNLAKHPEFQQKCRQEVLSLIGDKENITWDDVSKLEYSKQFLKENLRLFPPACLVGREMKKPQKLGSKGEIPRGTVVNLWIYSLHRNPHVWEKPEIFDPERFSKENVSKRNPFAFIPFSAGSRNCVGQQFAMLLMSVVLAHVLRKFELYLDGETPEPIMQMKTILKSRDGIFVKLRRR